MHRRTLPWATFALAIALCSSAPGRALAFDGDHPKYRFGVSLGLAGSIPIGSDVGQGGGEPDEYENALWGQFELLTVDIGEHINLFGYGRVAFVGGINDDAFSAGGAAAGGGGGAQGGGTTTTRLYSIGGGVRYLPLKRSLVRPYISFAPGYAHSSVEFPVPAAGAQPSTGYHRHRGVALGFGVGVRIEPRVEVFGEDALLPITIELQYIKNIWRWHRSNLDDLQDAVVGFGEAALLGIDDPDELASAQASLDALKDADFKSGLASKNMNVDFLGLMVTVGFLR